MPFVKNENRGFATLPQAPAEPAAPTLGQTFSAAWQMENDVANAIDYMSRPAFTPQEGFTVGPALRDYDTKNRTEFFKTYGDRFMGVRSEDQMLYTINRINEQNAQREVIERAGVTGFVASVASGLASPASFIPFIAGGRRLEAVAKGALSGLAASIPSEAILYNNQESRTMGEVGFSLAASTALGGLLGGAASALRKGEMAGLEEEIVSAAKPASVGAAAVELPDAGGLASGASTLAKVNDATRIFTNPVTQTIDQKEFETFRVFMQQLSDSGLRMEKNADGVATSVGGTIENRLHDYAGKLVQGDEKFDEGYAKYIFGDNVPGVAPNIRAQLTGQFGSQMSVSEFSDQVTQAIWAGYKHPVPEVAEVAKATADTIFEPILKRAQEVKLYPEDVQVVGDEAYASRIYNTLAIKADTDGFVRTLAANYEKNLGQRFADELNKFNRKQERQQTLLKDLQRSPEEVEAFTEKFKRRLEEIDENLPFETQMLEDAIATNRATARNLLKGPQGPNTVAQRAQLLADARDMEKAAGPGYAAIKAERAELRRRLSNLNKAVLAVEEKHAKKLARIEKIEDLNIASLSRLIKKAQGVLKNLSRWSDDKLDEEVSRLKTQFEQAGRLYDRGEERLVKLAEDQDMIRLGLAEEKQLTRAERLDSIVERLDKAEGLPREEIRQALEDSLSDTIKKVAAINERRVLRGQRLREQLAKLDPKVAKGRLESVAKSIPQAEGDFIRRWQGPDFKATSVDLGKGLADFRDIARQSAELVKDKILGTYLRLPYSELLAERRGGELRRVLHIPSSEISKFLETDIRKITRVYVRTLAPDIEIMDKFGTLNGEELLKPMIDEMNAKIEALGKQVKPENMDVKKWEALQAEKSRKINDDFNLYKKNVLAVIERLRGTRGMPSDPEGFAYRASRLVMNLNVLRQMGMVVVSSFPDLARPVMRYGLTRVFKDGFLPLITNLKAMKLNAHEAKLAGVGTNLSAHMRSIAYRDITDELHRGSRLEKAVEWTTNRMGMVALFDYWTQAGELLSSAVANGKLMDALAKVNTGDGDMAEAAAITYLGENGINAELAQKIWNEVSNGGGGKVEGVWWPNTESWKDPKALRAYRAALAREALITIPRPGAERALLADANMLGRMLYQFKSFGMSSTSKILMSGLQQRDMAVLNGAVCSLALGALSYYTWAMVAGEKERTKMLNAGIDKWADEAINRAGLTGNFSEFQRVAQTIPLFAPYASFSGSKQTRRPGDNLGEALLGPSFDFFQKTTNIIGDINNPTQSTLREARRLTPFQNTLILREAIDAVENAVATQLPEKRTK